MKITPTKSVREGWNGTVAGVKALARSLELNHRCRKLTYSDLKRMLATANYHHDEYWKLEVYDVAYRYTRIGIRILEAMAKMPIENVLKGEPTK